MKKIRIVTLARLNRALRTTTSEFHRYGIWNNTLASIPVNLIPFSRYYGWQAYGTSGEINFLYSRCAVCGSGITERTFRWLMCCATNMRMPFAYCYPTLIQSKAFIRAFVVPHDSEASVGFIYGFHLTEYAATSPAEDFAKTFMLFMRGNGRLKREYQFPLIRKKWQFIHKLCRAIHSGKRSVA